MTHPVVTVENLSKAYRIGAKEEVPDTIVGAVTGVLRAPWKNAKKLRQLSSMKEGDEADDILWALKDVSFEINEGEVVGIIGRNGAGKSTLLKILSRITEPTGGRATIRGRVSSLLEVGTGFHPELTGRENIYMNGTILGMTKREIDRKFDEIVDFSGVEKFLDTPTKRYSSGMQVRLAFSVAAHLEPEILIIDEVLAVGDAEFQKKCLGKMKDVAGEGRTVLFVSHNLSAVRSLCNRGIVLDSGLVGFQGTVDDSLGYYGASVQKKVATAVRDRVDRGGSGDARLTSMLIDTGTEEPIQTGMPLLFYLDYESDIDGVDCVLTVYDSFGEAMLSFNSSNWTNNDTIEDPAGTSLLCELPECPLTPGEYRINVALQHKGVQLDHIEAAGAFHVDNGLMRNRRVGGKQRHSRFVAPHYWTRST